MVVPLYLSIFHANPYCSHFEWTCSFNLWSECLSVPKCYLIQYYWNFLSCSLIAQQVSAKWRYLFEKNYLQHAYIQNSLLLLKGYFFWKLYFIAGTVLHNEAKRSYYSIIQIVPYHWSSCKIYVCRYNQLPGLYGIFGCHCNHGSQCQSSVHVVVLGCSYTKGLWF